MPIKKTTVNDILKLGDIHELLADLDARDIETIVVACQEKSGRIRLKYQGNITASYGLLVIAQDGLMQKILIQGE